MSFGCFADASDAEDFKFINKKTLRGEELVVQVKERLGILPQVGRDILKIEASGDALRLAAGELSFVLVIPNPYLEHR